MLKELQDMGLSEKEAKVYLASLEVGRATADQLAKQAKIVRSTTYVQIESLMKKGLMSTYEEGKKTYFAPESPEYLKRIFELKKKELEAKEAELKDFLPELLQKFEGAGERPVVRFFDGKEGIASLREEALSTKDKQLIVLSSNDALNKVFSDAERTAYSQRRSAKDITTKLLYTRESGKISDEPQPHTERGFLKPDQLNLATDILIFDDKVGIMTLKGKLLGVLIQSKEVRDSMAAIFNLLWSQAEKH
jgi:HTH-type transcriptional regulator, sugar sensing transcriptional regulator